MTDIYLTFSLSTHNGDGTPQNYDGTNQTRVENLGLVGSVDI